MGREFVRNMGPNPFLWRAVMNFYLDAFSGFAWQAYNGVCDLAATAQEVIKSLDLDSIDDDKETERSEGLGFIGEKLPVTPQFSFPVVYQTFARSSHDFHALKKQVEDYYQEYLEKLKIEFGNDPVGEKGNPVWIGYSAAEFNVISSMPDCIFLRDYFCHFKGNIFRNPDYESRFYGSYVEEISLNTLRKEYEKMPKKLASSIRIHLPHFDHFSGSASEIQQIFSALLEKNEGILIGESFGYSISKQLLQEQMQYLAGMGVKILFLEHCCYDTLQAELNQFFQAKKASSFLENFLKKGCGCLNESINFYEMIKSAVDAGIRPIGLERSATQCFGYSTDDSAARADRMLGLNVGATEIIKMHKGEGKYVALVGSNHLSYHDDIAGLSELCGIPSMYVESGESVSESSLLQAVINLGLSNEKWGNKIHDHFVHCKLIFKMKSEENLEEGFEFVNHDD